MAEYKRVTGPYGLIHAIAESMNTPVKQPYIRTWMAHGDIVRVATMMLVSPHSTADVDWHPVRYVWLEEDPRDTLLKPVVRLIQYHKPFIARVWYDERRSDCVRWDWIL